MNFSVHVFELSTIHWIIYIFISVSDVENFTFIYIKWHLLSLFPVCQLIKITLHINGVCIKACLHVLAWLAGMPINWYMWWTCKSGNSWGIFHFNRVACHLPRPCRRTFSEYCIHNLCVVGKFWYHAWQLLPLCRFCKPEITLVLKLTPWVTLLDTSVQHEDFLLMIMRGFLLLCQFSILATMLLWILCVFSLVFRWLWGTL